MNESEQAQAIAQMKEDVTAYEMVLGKNEHTKKYRMLLEIVDSQAQKIAEQAKTIEINAAYAIELQGKMSEQTKEIERLKKDNSQFMDYIVERCRRAESQRVPKDLKENIKAAVLVGMDATRERYRDGVVGASNARYYEYRKLCEPEVNP